MDEVRPNLRSKKRECRIPIQLQMAGDEDFMATLGPSTSRMGQVSFTEHSDSGSESDIDISDLINHSDKISSPVLASGRGASSNEGKGSLGDTQVSQNDINQQILSQLASLGDRLTNVVSNQSKFTKKTVHA